MQIYYNRLPNTPGRITSFIPRMLPIKVPGTIPTTYIYIYIYIYKGFVYI